ncbi:MAG: pitrilysin family protein [Acidobacteriota bacterium]|nr:pitrilysin family protein [Acidobacteriota bacterium]
MRRFCACLSILLLSCVLQASAQDLASFEKRVHVRTLPNGLTVLLLQRPEAPVFSFFTVVDAGDAQDPLGKTGLAHMMEHMAFKGTENIGTTNYSAEKAALAKVEQAYAAYDRENIRTNGRDEKKVAELEAAWKAARADADQYVIQNEFGELIERNGGLEMNASTGFDSTQYYYSLPANRLELWAYLESERFLHPVMREFYKERDVVMEERRMRIDSSPTGRLVEQFLSIAFDGSPYHRPSIGYTADLKHFSATDAANFFQTYYVPSNMVIALVGDLDPDKTFAVVDRYFGRIPAGPKPEEYITAQTPQTAERTVTLYDPSQPFYLEGYQVPRYRDKDDAVYHVISSVMSAGRTSRLYRSLVRDRKIAMTAAGFSGLPGNKLRNLYAFYAVPAKGHTAQEMASAIHEEIEKIKKDGVTEDELKMVKTRSKAALLRSLDNNQGLAINLAQNQLKYGDWRELFRDIDKIDAVTNEDIKRVAAATFVESNRTVGIIETKSAKGGK